MKIYIRIFLLALVFFSLIFGVSYAIFDRQLTASIQAELEQQKEQVKKDEVIIDNDITDEVSSTENELEKLVRDSNRVNFLCVGMEDYRTDTIMLVSYDQDKQIVDVLSIPRDTYLSIPGYDAPGQKKINSIYGMRNVGGINGLQNYVSDLAGVPIDYYVMVDYDGLSAVVDVLGGYDVYVPYDMQYDDPFDDPPLHIDIKEGQQNLDGEETMKYLRFRKSNDGTIQEGDIQRIERQQAFIKAMVKKSLSLRLPSVINTAIHYVDTDVSIGNAAMLATSAVGLSMENVHTYTIPGEPGYSQGTSYFFHDPGDLEALMIEIYSQ